MTRGKLDIDGQIGECLAATGELAEALEVVREFSPDPPTNVRLRQCS